MLQFKIQLPEGGRDIIASEAYAKRCAEQRAREMLLRSGYEEVETPTFEYAHIFESAWNDVECENMLRFFDENGRLLTMRPDFTLPCARMVSALRESFPVPIRLFYVGNAFGLEHNTGRQRKEFSQIGAELMGLGGVEADAEIIAVASQVIEHMGLTDYILDIGHMGAFQTLWKQAALSRQQADALRYLLDQKNAMEAKDMMESFGVQPLLQEQFVLLTNLYGGVEVLQEAKKHLIANGCQEALAEMERLCKILQQYGLGSRITIDLGHLTNMDYYTGTVFSAMADGIGSPLLSGGRYDNVLGQFGRPMPATGFAVSIGHVLSALENADAWEKRPPVSVLIGTTPANIGKAFAIASQRRRLGDTALTILCLNCDEFLQKQESIGSRECLWIEEDAPEWGSGR